MVIDNLFKFISFTQHFRAVERDVYISGTTRYENDSEHSYQLALTAWYLCEELRLAHDRNKILKYALVHDLVETYAGDTPAFSSQTDYKDSKDDREEQSRKKIISELPFFSELHTSIDDYNLKNENESRFVYVVDKIMPMLNQYPQDTSYYKNEGITFEKWTFWLNGKLTKINYNPEVDNNFITDFLEYLKTNQKEIFADNV
jgi:putative hydrolases of HD superfamily